MRLQHWTKYLLSHRIQALALTFIITFIPMIGVLGILFAALVTIRKGIVEGAAFTIAATLPYCFIRLYVPGGEAVEPLFVWVAVAVGAFSNFMTWVLASMLNRRASWSAVLQIAALLGVLLISVVHLVYPDVFDWWANFLHSLSAQTPDAITALKSNAMHADADSMKEAQIQAINAAKWIATGSVVGVTLLVSIMQLILACWWEAIVFKPGSLRLGLRHIRLSPLAGVLFIASLVFSYLGNAVVLDIMPVLYLLFCGAGLSLLHYFFGLLKTPVAWFWLVLLYATLILAMPISVVAIATLALLDIWLDFRRRFKKV